MKISLTSSEYRASEEEQTMVVVVKKDKQIASPLSLTITPATVAQAETWTNIQLPQIPADNNHFSPNRATSKAVNNHVTYSIITVCIVNGIEAPMYMITVDAGF